MQEEFVRDALLTAEVGTDAVIRRQLREGAGAAGPLVLVMNFLRGVVVIGIIERSAIGQNRPRAGDRVVQDAFHAVAVARITGDAQQVTRDLEMAVNPAGRLEAGVRQAQALPEPIAPRRDKRFVRTPAAGDITLFAYHAKTVGRGAQIFFIAEN